MTEAHKRAIAKGIRKARGKRGRKKYYRRAAMATPEMSRKDRELLVCQQALTILDRILVTALS